MMKGATEGRNYGVDLLRLVFMFMVCLMHILGQGGVIQANSKDPLSYYIYWMLEVVSYCAVDGFALISGYMAANKPVKYEKLVDMWFQVFFYSFILTLIFTVVGFNENWTKTDILKSVFPMTSGYYWYFTAYFAMYLARPILNRFIWGIDETAAKKTLILMILLFSVLGLFGDPFKTDWGYSAIWVIVLYCIGALAKKVKLFESRKTITLMVLWAFCILVSWAARVLLDIENALQYISPAFLLSAIIMIVLFSRMKLKGTIIFRIAPCAFGVYLLQLNKVIWTVVIKNAHTYVVSDNVVIGFIYVFAFTAVLFIAGLVIEMIRSKVAGWIRLPYLSKKIAAAADKCLSKLSVLLR